MRDRLRETRRYPVHGVAEPPIDTLRELRRPRSGSTSHAPNMSMSEPLCFGQTKGAPEKSGSDATYRSDPKLKDLGWGVHRVAHACSGGCGAIASYNLGIGGANRWISQGRPHWYTPVGAD